VIYALVASTRLQERSASAFASRERLKTFFSQLWQSGRSGRRRPSSFQSAVHGLATRT
jgi:hypothetical protein